ncbi:hypothetical protein OSTOST_09485 [Ostertagia ostertagi]
MLAARCRKHRRPLGNRLGLPALRMARPDEGPSITDGHCDGVGIAPGNDVGERRQAAVDRQGLRAARAGAGRGAAAGRAVSPDGGAAGVGVELIAQRVGAALHRAGAEVGRAPGVGAGVQRHRVRRGVGAHDAERGRRIQWRRAGQRVDAGTEVQRRAGHRARTGDAGLHGEGVAGVGRLGQRRHQQCEQDGQRVANRLHGVPGCVECSRDRRRRRDRWLQFADRVPHHGGTTRGGRLRQRRQQRRRQLQAPAGRLLSGQLRPVFVQHRFGLLAVGQQRRRGAHVGQSADLHLGRHLAGGRRPAAGRLPAHAQLQRRQPVAGADLFDELGVGRRGDGRLAAVGLGDQPQLRPVRVGPVERRHAHLVLLDHLRPGRPLQRAGLPARPGGRRA